MGLDPLGSRGERREGKEEEQGEGEEVFMVLL